MEETQIDWRDRRIIMLLYKKQETLIELGEHSATAKIKRGVRQGCSLSPYLFNLFIKEIIDKYKTNSKEISINGEKIYCIKFTDNIAILSESEKDMQNSLSTLNKIFKGRINGHKGRGRPKKVYLKELTRLAVIDT